MKPSAPTAAAASRTSVSVASGLPKTMFSRTVPENRNASWGTMPICERSDWLVTVRRSWPSTSTRPRSGS